MTETVTLVELEWEGIGWAKLSEAERISVLEERLAQCTYGVVSMNADQVRAGTALLNKYRADRRTVETPAGLTDSDAMTLARAMRRLNGEAAENSGGISATH